MRTRILLAAAALTGVLAVGAPAAHAGTQATPNLYVVSLGSGVSSDCTSINVDAFYGNNGDVDSGAFGIFFTVDGKPVVRTRVPSVSPGAITHTREFALTWPNPTPGSHTLEVILDATNRVVESSETDNTLSQTFTCP
jgi:subtilase family serine protease